MLDQSIVVGAGVALPIARIEVISREIDPPGEQLHVDVHAVHVLDTRRHVTEAVP